MISDSSQDVLNDKFDVDSFLNICKLGGSQKVVDEQNLDISTELLNLSGDY